MTSPSPAIFAGRKKESPSESSTADAPTKSNAASKSGGTDAKAETRPRVPRILVNHPELEEVMTRLKEDEQINKRHGWYDRNRNGRGRLPKGTKPNPPKTSKEKN